MIIIRPATIDDNPAIMPMARLFYDTLPYKDIGFCERTICNWTDLMRERGVILVAESDGTLVGMAGGLFSPFIFNDAYRIGAELMWWVSPEHRRNGVGRQLLAALEQFAYAHGCIRWSMIAVMDGSQERIGALYEQAGYQAAEITYTKRAP